MIRAIKPDFHVACVPACYSTAIVLIYVAEYISQLGLIERPVSRAKHVIVWIRYLNFSQAIFIWPKMGILARVCLSVYDEDAGMA